MRAVYRVAIAISTFTVAVSGAADAQRRTSATNGGRRATSARRTAAPARVPAFKPVAIPANNPNIKIENPKSEDLSVTLLGEFGKPGVIAYHEGMTVREAVAVAEGFTASAETSSLTLRRVGEQAFATLDGARALEGDLIQNASLKPGDVLFAPAKKISEPVPNPVLEPEVRNSQSDIRTPVTPAAPFVFDESLKIQVDGEVEKPGIYLYAPMKLSEVFEKVGGLKKDADRGKIVIFRGTAEDPAQAQQIKYDLNSVLKGKTQDIELQPGDVIQVPRRKKSFWQKVGDGFKRIGTRSLLGGVPVVGPLLGGLSGS